MANRTLEERFNTQIQFAVDELGDHGGITRAKVIRWIQQVTERRRSLAAKVLGLIRYYAGNNIHSMTQQLADFVYAEYADIKKNRIYFVPIGAAGSGAQVIARHLKTIRNVPNANVIDLLELYRMRPERVQVVVAFDDFSGTGQTINDWWDNNETIIRPIDAEIVIGVLVLNHLARASLEKITNQVMTVEELRTNSNVFHDDFDSLTVSEKRSLLTLCRKTGCSPKYIRARGDCGLLIAFKHGCPNNSIPILWHEKERVWEALFRRRSA